MKVISLIDNESINKNLYKEHGLSLYIEVDNLRLIFDTGSSGNFIKNAIKLSLDLKSIDYVVISHGHYDHTGGLKEFLKLNTKAKVILKKNCVKEYYSKKSFYYKYIGMDKSLLNNYIDRFLFIEEDYQIDNNIKLITNIDKKNDNSYISRNLFVLEENILKKDNFKHELILTILYKNKLNIFSGCSHSGILNIIYTASTHFQVMSIDTVIGGFHLKSINNNSEYIYNLSKKLCEFNANKFYTCHCTGIKPYKLLKSIMKDKISYLSTGDKIEYI